MRFLAAFLLCVPFVASAEQINIVPLKAGAPYVLKFQSPLDCAGVVVTETVNTVREANITLKLGSTSRNGKGGSPTALWSEGKGIYTVTVTSNVDTPIAVVVYSKPKAKVATGNPARGNYVVKEVCTGVK